MIAPNLESALSAMEREAAELAARIRARASTASPEEVAAHTGSTATIATRHNGSYFERVLAFLPANFANFLRTKRSFAGIFAVSDHSEKSRYTPRLPD